MDCGARYYTPSQDSSIIYDSPIADPSIRTLLGSVRLQVLRHTTWRIISLEEKLQLTSKKPAFQLRESSEAVVKNLCLRT